MVPINRRKVSLYEEAKNGLNSLVWQTATVFVGFIVMLLLTGGNPSGFAITIIFILGIAFVAWREQKRVTNLRKEPDGSLSLDAINKRVRPQKRNRDLRVVQINGTGDSVVVGSYLDTRNNNNFSIAIGGSIDSTNYQYKIVKVVGEGNLGITYLAKRSDGLDVIVKTLNDTMQNKPEFNDLQAKFMKEAFFLKGCKHPHIVKILDISQSANLWCIVMEAIDGETLWERVERKGALPESEAWGYIQQIGSALKYMHNLEVPILHCDLNPKNIMIRRRTEGKGEDAVLIDFGLARKFVQDKTGKNTAMVFSGFAPIEQYDENAKRGVYSDVYSLAAVLYFAVTAEVPMTSLDIVAGAVLVPPSQIQPNIDRRVEEAILYGMKLKVKERPKSVQQWIDLIN